MSPAAEHQREPSTSRGRGLGRLMDMPENTLIPRTQLVGPRGRAPTDTGANEPVRLHKPALLAVLLTMLFMYQADATIVNVATPSIRADLSASGAELELVIGGYLVASATLLITGARLGHMRGYRRVFLVGL